MKKLFTIFTLLCFTTINAQIFEKVYNKLFKYSTIYVAGDIREAAQTQYPDYFIRTDPDDLYAIPRVVDETIYHPFDYRLGFGIRRLARFDYEIKQNYIDGTENMKRKRKVRRVWQ